MGVFVALLFATTFLATACDSSSQPSSNGSTRLPEASSSSAPSMGAAAGPDIKSQTSPVNDAKTSETTSKTAAPPISASIPAESDQAITYSAPAVMSSAPANPYGPPTLDEIIFATDIIAIVRPISSESATLTVRETDGQTIYSPVVQTNYEVVEYLKGDGDSEIVVNANDFSKKARSAEESLPSARSILAAQTSNLDGGEGVVFIQRIEYPENVLDISLRESETGWRRYNVQTGLFSTKGDIGNSSATLHIASGSVAAHAAGKEVFSIGELRDRIEAMEDMLSKGQGIEGYEECIRSMLLFENFRRKNEEFLSVVADVATFQSGMPADFVVHEFSTTYPRQWFSGDNAPLFHYGDNEISTTRPIPDGAYEVYAHFQEAEWMPCDYIAPPTTWRYTFESDALHEAFFDPVDLGDAVGAGSGNGVLNPYTFDAEGATETTIERIEWVSGSVRIELDPHDSLAGHHIDFIALDGTVSLRLDFDDASEIGEGTSRALSWNVCEQPWSEGDLLMLRISESPENLLGATNNASCPGDAAATPAPTATATPDP